MSDTLADRVGALSDQEAAHYLNLLARSAARDALLMLSGTEGGARFVEAALRIGALSDQEVAHYLNLIAGSATDTPGLATIRAELDQPEAMLTAESDGVEGARSARDALLLLSVVDGGAAIVEAALAQPAPATADFGLISGPALLIVAYIAVTARIKVKIGGVEIEKEGIPGDKQVEVAKAFLTGFARAVIGM